MRKLFLAICFSLVAGTVQADVTRFVDVAAAQQYQQQNQEKPLTPEEKTKYFKTKDELIDYIQDRFEKAHKSLLDENGEIVGMRSMDVQSSDAYVQQQQSDNKPTFQKIYESALNKLSNSPSETQRASAPSSAVDQARARAQQQQALYAPELPMISAQLPPFGRSVMVPATEHIAYFFADIVILPNGMFNINETITVVANGEKLKYGLTRAIPKSSVSRSGERHDLDLNIIDVRLNGRPVEYQLEETSDYMIMAPKEQTELAPGVYTYHLNYSVDRRLWYYDDFNEFYWDVTGSNWNMVIARAGASLSLPDDKGFLGHSFLLGYPGYLKDTYALTMQGVDNSLGFVSTKPLYLGEGMFIIASFAKDGFINPDFTKRFLWFIDDYGNALFSLLGLLAIAGSYFLSWRDMKKKNSGTTANLRKNAPMLRYLIKGVYDKVSFGAFLLELYKRNIIDIIREGGEIRLVKKTDAAKGLSKAEKKALNELFINKESVLKIESNNALKIKRAYKGIEADIVAKFKNFTLRMNLGYLGFSCGMMLVSLVGIAFNQVEVLSSLVVLIANSIILGAAIYLIKKTFRNIWVNRGVKTTAAVVFVFWFFILGVLFGGFTALMISLMIVTIFVYTKLFATKEGLVKNNIKQAEDYKEFLIKNKETISLGRDFVAQQPSIFALELEKDYPNNPNIKDYYRLDIVSEIVNKM